MVDHKRCFVPSLATLCLVVACIANASDEETSVAKTSGSKYDGQHGVGASSITFPTIDFAAANQQQSMLAGGTLAISIPENHRWSSEKSRNGGTHAPSKSHAKLYSKGFVDLGNAATLQVRFRGGYGHCLSCL